MSCAPGFANPIQAATPLTQGAVRHRTSAYLNNRLEQDHRGIKGRIRCMRGFKSHDAARRFCREHRDLRNLLRPRRRHNQIVSASSRRARFARGARIALDIMAFG